MNPVYYAVLAGSTFGLWIALHKLASVHVAQVFGALVVSAFAVLTGLLVLGSRGFLASDLSFTHWGLFLALFAGACAFGVDFFTLKAFSGGVPASVGGPIIVGLSVALPVLFGFFVLGEQFTFLKILAISLVFAGVFILARIA